MAAHQAPLSLGFSRQEHWTGLPLPSPMHACMLSHFSRVQICATLWTAGSSVHGILWGRILEWVAVSSSSSMQLLLLIQFYKHLNLGYIIPVTHWLVEPNLEWCGRETTGRLLHQVFLEICQPHLSPGLRPLVWAQLMLQYRLWLHTDAMWCDGDAPLAHAHAYWLPCWSFSMGADDETPWDSHSTQGKQLELQGVNAWWDEPQLIRDRNQWLNFSSFLTGQNALRYSHLHSSLRLTL